MEQNNTMDELLVSYLLGEATAQQKQEVEAWVAADAANKKYFEHFKNILEESRNIRPNRQVDENAAWMRLVQRAEADEQATYAAEHPHRTIPLFQRTWVRIAAMLVIFAGVGIALYTKEGAAPSMVSIRSGNVPLTDTLPDGSVIVLNRNSTLEYPAKFAGTQRNVTLTGEAFFEITPNKEQPFIIEANGTSVKVVGTSFNVKTSPQRTEVIVETGIVQVARKSRSVKLTPNQKTVMEAATGEAVAESNVDELYNYYRTGKFVCNATPLHKLTDVLQEAYDVHIVIADKKLANLPITTTFTKEPIDEILKVVAATLNITEERVGNDIYLKPRND